MTTFFQDLRYGFRILLTKPAFSAVAIITLALGIGANTAIFGVINAVLRRPLPYLHSDRLVMLSIGDGEGKVSNTSFATYEDWRDRNQSFEGVAAIRSWEGTLTGPAYGTTRTQSVIEYGWEVMMIRFARSWA